MYESYCRKKEKNINAHLNNLKLTKQMQKELKDFLTDYSSARNLSVPAQESYVRSLAFFGQFLADKQYSSYKQAKSEDIKTYLRNPYPKNGKKKSESILVWVKSSLKVFYRWLLLGKVNRPGREDKYPELVDWIAVGIAKGKKLTSDDVITTEEFQKLLDATQNSRDRAFISLLFESGMRLGEALNLRIKDVHFNSDRTFVNITKSKTEPRPVYVFNCIPDLRSWLNQHPDKNNPDALLFVSIKRNKKREWGVVKWGYDGAWMILQRIAERAGIKKKVWVHLLRHSAATRDARAGMPTQLMKLKYGWSGNSRMADRYTHRNYEDVAKWQEKQLGIKNDVQADPQAPRKCPRCGELSPWTNRLCQRCGQALDVPAIMEKEALYEDIFLYFKMKEAQQRQ
jgi:site-specific recombinase XerD